MPRRERLAGRPRYARADPEAVFAVRAPLQACPLGADRRIGPEVVLEAGCRVGERVALRRWPMLPGATVPPDEVVTDRLVVQPLRSAFDVKRQSGRREVVR